MFVKCVFVWQTPFSHGLSYWFNASLIAEAPLKVHVYLYWHMWLLHTSENFPVFYHSTSFILSVCGCCIGKGSYRNTKHKYVVRGLGADVWFSLWFLSVCFVFHGTLSKNDHAGPTCWPDQTKPQNLVLFHLEFCCGPCYVLEQWLGLLWFSVDQGNTQIYFKEQGSIG